MVFQINIHHHTAVAEKRWKFLSKMIDIWTKLKYIYYIINKIGK